MSKTVEEFQNKLDAFIKKELSFEKATGFIGLIILQDEEAITFRVSSLFTAEDTSKLLELASTCL